ncbi:MAG: hypothetical protein JXA93_01870 [Anaerolineae bacterium]|nr:hypothetical protein [Anaerolineae bacterium]
MVPTHVPIPPHPEAEQPDGLIEALERLVQRETLREALALLTPDELLLAAGRVAGMSDRELGDLFCIRPAVVSRRLMQARRRIQAQIPELRLFLEGRSGTRIHSYTPLETEANAVYTLAKAAEQLGLSTETVALWVQQNKFPNAYRVAQEWWIPQPDVEAARSMP